MKEIESVLLSFGVAPTPVRKLVYKCLEEAERPLSLSDIETILNTVDKSTISRTLSTFKEHHFIHSFTDGSGSVKFELYSSPDNSFHKDLHVHFRCEKCGVTDCLQDVGIPSVNLPQGYVLHEAAYVITGICAECSGRKKYN